MDWHCTVFKFLSCFCLWSLQGYRIPTVLYKTSLLPRALYAVGIVCGLNDVLRDPPLNGGGKAGPGTVKLFMLPLLEIKSRVVESQESRSS